MATRGKPRANIDWTRVDEMARAHVNITAIARILNINKITLASAIEREFGLRASHYLQERKEEGTGLMREAIYRAGIEGNIIAQIFWLKNRDGWADKALVQHEVLPPVQLQLPPGVDEKSTKMVMEFFNTDDDGDKGNERIHEDFRSLPRREETDNSSGRAGFE